MKNLYNSATTKIMHAAESCGFGENRIEQIQSFALAAGLKRIGIANCITFTSETRIIQEFLSNNFEVFTVDCKYGRLSRSELFGRGGGTLCNPAGQANFLNNKKTELNLSIGLCVGHDMIFNMESDAPVTTLYTKDFSNGHNPDRAVAEISRVMR